MPSLFSRARTNSTPQKKPSSLFSNDNSPSSALDEFGRVSSRASNRAISSTVIPLTPSKKDRKKAKEQEKRFKTLGSHREVNDYDQQAERAFPDGSFLPLNLERPRDETNAGEQSKEHDYGYLSYERHVVLGLEQVARLVDVVSEELETRGGITEPFIFTNTALDISSSAIKRLIRTFINTCMVNPGHSANEAEEKWRTEARFSGPHELGMCLRWGIARVIRSVAGQDVRGLVSWEHYVEFRDNEAGLDYPPNFFEAFLQNLGPPLQAIIVRVLSLLARLTANSALSGHTPPTLSPLFGPLFFGLGPATLAFHHAYIHYLRAVNAMEHLILAFIRWQDTPRVTTSSGAPMLFPSGSAAGLGVPTRLKEWIKGYPSMLPFLQQSKNVKPQARQGARTVRVMGVRRNVRMYSPDLVKSASSWAASKPALGGLASSKEWERIAPSTLKLPPRYSETYKKRMNMPQNFHPDTGSGMAVPPTVSTSPSTSSYTSTMSSGRNSSLLGGDQDPFGLGAREGEDRFRSLTDLKWGEFESMGFSALGDEKKLQFDLTESARTERTAKRQTLSWNDFSSSGFTRTDGPLSATLQFSPPLSNSVSAWPAYNLELNKKLKKTQKALPAFGWDTEPVIGSEEVIEEAFVDVFCDLVYGGGWMDLERGEELDRDCNWALVEYKSLPPSRSTTSGGSDPRTMTTLILFEEFVPFEYRQQLAVTSSNRRRLPSLFSPGKSKQWKQAPTLNGRPYVVGHVPRSPSYREVEFEGLLRGGSATKVITLESKTAPTPRIQPGVPKASVEVPVASTPRNAISKPPYHPPEPDYVTPTRSEDLHSDSTMSTSAKRSSRFKLPGGIPVPSPGGMRKSGMMPAEYSRVEFETRMASYSDDEANDGPPEPEAVKQKRRASRDDAWVDILVNQNRRYGGLDAETWEGKRRGLIERRSDPELASLEVAQVLAAVQNRSPSPPSVNGRVDQDFNMDHHVGQHFDDDVDEVETVPRLSSSTDEDAAVLAYTEPTQDSIIVPPLDEDDDDEPSGAVMNARQLARQHRRQGYFDLHPERRQVVANNVLDEDPRLRLAKDESEDESDDDEKVHAKALRKLPVPPPPPPLALQQDVPRLNAPRHPLPVPPVVEDPITPKYDYTIETRKVEPVNALELLPQLLVPPPSSNGNGQKKDLPAPTPTSAPTPASAPTSASVPTPTPTSKTAALIEMYRERERGVPSKPATTPPLSVPIVIAPLAPSRLPVRTAASPKENPAAPTPLAVLAAPSPTALRPLPIPNPALPETDSTLVEPPRPPYDDTGRASPARYVHGAPLHNVLEEEEEEV